MAPTTSPVWVVAQHRDGKLHRMTWEAVAAGQRLAEALGGRASAVVLGSGVDGLASELAARIPTAWAHLLEATPPEHEGALRRFP